MFVRFTIRTHLFEQSMLYNTYSSIGKMLNFLGRRHVAKYASLALDDSEGIAEAESPSVKIPRTIWFPSKAVLAAVSLIAFGLSSLWVYKDGDIKKRLCQSSIQRGMENTEHTAKVGIYLCSKMPTQYTVKVDASGNCCR